MLEFPQKLHTREKEKAANPGQGVYFPKPRYLGTYMCVCPEIHRHTCRGQTTKGVTAQELITLFYDTGSLIGLELTSYCQLARQDRQGFTRFCLPSTDLPNAGHCDAWPFHLSPRCRTQVPSATPIEPSLRHLPERHSTVA